MNLQQPSDRLLRIPEVLHIVGVSRSKWYNLIDEDKAPGPVSQERRWTVWSLNDVDHWVKCKIEGKQWEPLQKGGKTEVA